MNANISLRNYFAASALQGMISEPSMKATPMEFAMKAYEVADAMIKCGGREAYEPKTEVFVEPKKEVIIQPTFAPSKPTFVPQKDAAYQPKNNFLKLKEVMAYVKKSRSSIYLEVKLGKFPKPIRFGIRKVVWNLSDIDEWIATRQRTNMDLSRKNDGSYK